MALAYSAYRHHGAGAIRRKQQQRKISLNGMARWRLGRSHWPLAGEGVARRRRVRAWRSRGAWRGWRSRRRRGQNGGNSAK